MRTKITKSNYIYVIKLLRFCGLEIFGFEACRFIHRVLKLGRYNLGLLITLRAIIKFWLEHLQRLVVLTLRDQAILHARVSGAAQTAPSNVHNTVMC